MLGIKGIEKIMPEEIRAKTGVKNKSENIVEATLVRTRGGKKRGRCSNQSMEDGSEWTSKDLKIKN